MQCKGKLLQWKCGFIASYKCLLNVYFQIKLKHILFEVFVFSKKKTIEKKYEDALIIQINNKKKKTSVWK